MDFINAMEPWMIPIIVMVCVTLIVAISVIGGIIKTKIRQDSTGNLSENKEFLAALREFKETMERRVSNLEAIASGGELTQSKSTRNVKKEPGQKNAIDIEIDSRTDQGEQESVQKGKLKNMLNQ